MHWMRQTMVLLIFTAVSATTASDGLSLKGFVSFKYFDGDGERSWLTEGTGKLPVSDDSGGLNTGRAHVSVTWEPSLYFQAYVHGIARLEPDEYQTDNSDGGITEAFLQGRAFAGANHRFRFRLGFFFPPTSMENVEDLWVSPYTLSLSALNSWIGEEVRWTGLDISYSYEFAPERVLFLGGSVFGGNDSVGALLAWRGWSFGERLSLYDEILPLPDLQVLSPNGFFGLQKDPGTLPFGEDLDDNPGFAGRIGLDLAGTSVIQVNYSDNKGDRMLYGGEYSWDTQILSAGFQYAPDDRWQFAGEYMTGETGMGPTAEPHVEIDLDTWYLLASALWGDWRASLRFDDFSIEDIDGQTVSINAGPNDEEGDALTLALFWSPIPQWRIGAEWLTLDVARQVLLITGPDQVTGGDMWTLEARYQF